MDRQKLSEWFARIRPGGAWFLDQFVRALSSAIAGVATIGRLAWRGFQFVERIWEAVPKSIAALGAAAIVYFGVPIIVQEEVQRWWLVDAISDGLQRLRVRKMGDNTYNILVADLGRDDSNMSATEEIMDLLNEQLGKDSPITTQRARRRLKLPRLKEVDEPLQVAVEEGRSWLKKFNADVLVVGDVGSKLPLLSFITQSATTDGARRLTDANEFSDVFGADVAGVLALYASSLATAERPTARYVSDVLSPQIVRLKDLVATSPSSFNEKQKVMLAEGYAVALSRIVNETRIYDQLPEAIAHLQSAEAYWRNHDIARMARVKHALGVIHLMLGERSKDLATLRLGQAYFVDALLIRTKDASPRDWAITQNALGTILVRIGEIEEKPERISEALTAFTSALAGFDAKLAPLDVAMVHDNIGSATALLAQCQVSPHLFHVALDAFQEAQKYQPPMEHPIAWASTEANIAIALVRFAGCDPVEERVDEVIARSSAAINLLDAKKSSFDWGRANFALGRAKLMKGVYFSQKNAAIAKSHFQSARAAFAAAVDAWPRTREPKRWVTAQGGLAEAVLNFAEHEEGTKDLETSIALVEEILAHTSRDKDRFEWTFNKIRLAWGRVLLAHRASTCENLARAKFAVDEALNATVGTTVGLENTARKVFDDYMLFAETQLPCD